jgi:hypothetical protein
MGRVVGEGQQHAESRALAQLALYRNCTVALLNDPVRCRETESGAFPHALGREERIEDARARLLGPELRRDQPYPRSRRQDVELRLSHRRSCGRK